MKKKKIETLSPYFVLRNQLYWLCIITVVVGGFAVNYAAKHEHIRPADPKPAPAKIEPPPPATENLSKPRPAYPSRSVFGKKREPELHPIIFQTANRYQVDPALVNAIIMAESEYYPRAVSRRGARGLMQLMPATAKELGVKDIFNPEQNIDGGVRYFKKLLNRYDGDVILALAAYNAGSRKVRHYRGVPPFKATKRYIRKVFKYYRIYKEQMAVTMS